MSSQEFDENHQFYVKSVLDIIKRLHQWYTLSQLVYSLSF
jgi:hypothetical protein